MSLGSGCRARLLRGACEVDSDFELASFLVRLLETVPVDGELEELFERALETVGSSHERERVLTARAGSTRER